LTRFSPWVLLTVVSRVSSAAGSIVLEAFARGAFAAAALAALGVAKVAWLYWADPGHRDTWERLSFFIAGLYTGGRALPVGPLAVVELAAMRFAPSWKRTLLACGVAFVVTAVVGELSSFVVFYVDLSLRGGERLSDFLANYWFWLGNQKLFPTFRESGIDAFFHRAWYLELGLFVVLRLRASRLATQSAVIGAAGVLSFLAMAGHGSHHYVRLVNERLHEGVFDAVMGALLIPLASELANRFGRLWSARLPDECRHRRREALSFATAVALGGAFLAWEPARLGLLAWRPRPSVEELQVLERLQDRWKNWANGLLNESETATLLSAAVVIHDVPEVVGAADRLQIQCGWAVGPDDGALSSTVAETAVWVDGVPHEGAAGPLEPLVAKRGEEPMIFGHWIVPRTGASSSFGPDDGLSHVCVSLTGLGVGAHTIAVVTSLSVSSAGRSPRVLSGTFSTRHRVVVVAGSLEQRR
jgi:hypothetical protein